jgi:hypothetical protein
MAKLFCRARSNRIVFVSALTTHARLSKKDFNHGVEAACVHIDFYSLFLFLTINCYSKMTFTTIPPQAPTTTTRIVFVSALTTHARLSKKDFNHGVEAA